jgi:16S rRNA (uracil1498-N3)-methyltransferase
MGSPHRFYADIEESGVSGITLSPEESHHARRVLRVRDGEAAVVFNGRGAEWSGRIETPSKDRVAVAVEKTRREDEPAPPLTLAIGWLHREKLMGETIRRGVELGVSRFLFFPAARSEKAPAMNNRWQRFAIESCKQCGRLWLPVFEIADSFDAVLKNNTGGDLLLFTLSGETMPLPEALTGAPVTVLIGPEGDFTPEEQQAARDAGARPVSLGMMTFRSEVAAVVGVSLVQYELGRLGPKPGA